ncbi:MAG TPA: tetratricopeptide repeat protein [Vicinamibacterales bacterium]
MKRVLAGIVLLVLTGAAVYGYTVSERERRYRDLIGEGDAALARDNTAAAIEAFSGAITLKPDSMLGYFKRGQTYHRRSELSAALRDLHRASDIDPMATGPLEELGDVLLVDSPHRYSAAADHYAAYVRLDNRAPRVLYKLAFARYNDGRLADAIDAVHASLALDNRSADAYFLLGLCERDAQHPEPARQSLERAIQLQPAMLHAREQLADLDGGRNTEARLAQLEALAALDPRASRDITLGVAYLQAGQPERAVLTLSHAAERYRDEPAIYVALGRVWLEIAQARHDRVALNKALEALAGAAANDNSSEGLTLFGRALLLASDAEGAERMLEDATAKQPVDPLAFLYLAEAAERQKHYATARQALLDYAALRGDEPEARRRSAEAARVAALSLQLNDPTTAATYFLRAAEDAPNDAGLIARAADAQLRAGDRDTARGTAARALEKDPANPVALAVLRRADR